MKHSILLFLISLFLVGCFQEDPQIQILRAKLAETEKELSETKTELDSRPLLEGGEDFQEKNEELQAKVEQLMATIDSKDVEIQQLSDKASSTLTEEELLINLRAATTSHREKIRENYDVVNVRLTNFSGPESVTHPYHCGVFYELTEKATGRPYHLNVAVNASLAGEWEVPPIESLQGELKPGHGDAIASNTQTANTQSAQPTAASQPVQQQRYQAQPVQGIPSAAGNLSFDPNQRRAPAQQPNGNNLASGNQQQGTVQVNGLPGGGAVSQPSQPGRTNRSEAKPKGPGMPISRDITVQW